MAIEHKAGRVRVALLGTFVAILFLMLIGRLWYLQVINETSYVERAADNTTDVIIEQAPRGRILDVHGRVLVDNRPSIMVTLDKEEVSELPPLDRDDLFYRLAKELGRAGRLTKVATIVKAFESNRYGPFAEVPVARDISETLQVFLAEHGEEFPGVHTAVVTVRDYPFGSLAAHLLGYVGPLNEQELVAAGKKPKTYQPNDEIGKSGVELFYEDALRGTPGRKDVTVDKFGHVLSEEQVVEPEAGSDLRLTIDIDLQALAEEELAAGLARAREQKTEFLTGGIVVYTAPAGATVILDPRDGSVRAMASYPTYDPSLFVSGITEGAFAELNDPANELPLLNRAIQGTYAPGSTFKPFSTYAALDTGLIGSRGLRGVSTAYEDTGVFTIPDCESDTCRFTNAEEKPLGAVDLPLALALSSDTYFYSLAAGFDRLYGFDKNSIQIAARQFGYGAITGVTLSGEVPGFIPDEASRKAAYDANPELFISGNWGTGDTVITAIGQGDVLATPMQIANSYAAIANGGTLFVPNIADAVLDPLTGVVEIDYGARVKRELYWPPAYSGPVLQGLAGVTQYNNVNSGHRGTAYDAFVDFDQAQWPVSGKTGTSEKHVPGRLVADYALFVGFGPADDPEFVAVTVLEEAGFGGVYAAPVVANIFRHIAEGTVPAHPTLAEAAEGVAPAADEAPEGDAQEGDAQ